MGITWGKSKSLPQGIPPKQGFKSGFVNRIFKEFNFCRALDFQRAGISSTTLYQVQSFAEQEFPSVGVYKIQTIVTYPHICKDKIFLVAKNSVVLLAGGFLWNTK